jgi:hypothetical protein
MDFDVVRGDFGNVDRFKARATMTYEAKFPERIAVAQFPAEEKVVKANQVSIVGGIVAHDAGDFLRKFGRDFFVSVKQEHPLVFPCVVFERPVALARAAGFASERNYGCSMRAGDLYSAVIAGGIHDDNFVSPRHARKTLCEIDRFVSRRNQD